MGACCNAPMAAINDYYFEDLTPDSFRQIHRRLPRWARRLSPAATPAATAPNPPAAPRR